MLKIRKERIDEDAQHILLSYVEAKTYNEITHVYFKQKYNYTDASNMIDMIIMPGLYLYNPTFQNIFGIEEVFIANGFSPAVLADLKRREIVFLLKDNELFDEQVKPKEEEDDI